MPIVVPRPDIANGLRFEGPARDADLGGWQVTPYSTTRGHCKPGDADSVMGRLYIGRDIKQLVFSPAEARRQGAAWIALADAIEQPSPNATEGDPARFAADSAEVEIDPVLVATLIRFLSGEGDELLVGLGEHARDALAEDLAGDL